MAVTPGGFDPTPEQAEAITAPLEAQLLVAGAGAGKTTVMAQRILHLVGSGQVADHQVLGLTFTNKAAQHLKEAVRAALGPDSDVTIATYHSFGASLVAEHGLELDLAPGTQVLNRAQSWQLLFAVFDEFRFDRRSAMSPEFVLNDALALASRCADHLVPVDAVEADCRQVMETGRWKGMRDTAASRLELCQVVAAYERRKRERNLLDFGDQVGLAVRLLTENPDVAAEERRRHPVVLLDEYQDTNFAQRRLLQLLYPPGAAVTAVGDDMQSIYGFRGAHLVNILRFPDHFPPVTVRQLQTTFRFGAALGTLANRIQDQVDESLKKVLQPLPDAPETVIECFLAADDAEEAGAIAADIAAKSGPGTGGHWSDVAVLCRKRRLIQPIVAALEERRVPVEAVGSSGLLDRPEVVDVVAWLEVLADPTASVALLRLLAGPRYRIGLRDLAVLSRHSRQLAHYDDAAQAEVDAAAAAATAGPDDQPRIGLPLAPPPQVETVLADALGDLSGAVDLSPEARDRLEAFDREHRHLADLARRLSVLDLVEAILARTGLWQAVGAVGRQNLLRFLDLAERFRPVEGDPGLAAFVEYLHLLDDSEEDVAEAHLGDADAVRVMTIHQAKGLEFATVYVPGMAGARGPSRIFPDGRPGENALGNSSALPWWLREDDEGFPPITTARMADIDDVIRRRKLDEEWRLLYVACTRAQRRLVCSAAHWYPGAAEPQGPSAFYDFVAGQTDIVSEWFRHEPATVDPEVAAKERFRAAADRRYPDPVASELAGQLRLDSVLADPPEATTPARRQAPTALSVTGLVSYARCPKQFYWSVVRPLPRRSSPAARLGTEVHRWIEQRAGRQLLLLEPDAPPATTGGADVVRRLKDSFLASPWADLDPVRVEAPFVLALGAHLVRGRVDAVYERDGRLELVDFKTGRPHAGGDGAAQVQLDLYGLAALQAWSAEPDRLRTTYCWLRTDGPPVVESADWSETVAERVRTRVARTLDALAAGRWHPSPGRWCTGCDFQAVCPEGSTVGRE
ncbi:MAG: ATP-dependent helicase UvrD/PcrA [Actinomycetota bacterium]|jgi:DNA helicase-2/ATP-dependent DNA helicase PcrA|nr:ATP-dependent helicase UvrD/PcrA [Actinomycetota bacterium]